MQFSHHLIAAALGVMASSAMAEAPSPSGAQAPIRILAPSAPCHAATARGGGKVEEIYWTNGPYNARVTTDEVDHYVDLNVVIKTTGYRSGDCIEATLQAGDGQDVATGTREIVLRGRVNEIGYVFFEAPMRRYTVILR